MQIRNTQQTTQPKQKKKGVTKNEKRKKGRSYAVVLYNIMFRPAKSKQRYNLINMFPESLLGTLRGK